MSNITINAKHIQSLAQIHELQQLSSFQLSVSESIPSNLSASSPFKPNRSLKRGSTDIKTMYPSRLQGVNNFQDQTNLLDSSVRQQVHNASNMSAHLNQVTTEQQLKQMYPKIGQSLKSAVTTDTATTIITGNNNNNTDNNSKDKQNNKNINNYANHCTQLSNQNVTISSKHIILQAQIIKLQNKCTTLAGIIHQLCKEHNISADSINYQIRNIQTSQSEIDASSMDNSRSIHTQVNSSGLSCGQEVEGLTYLQKYVLSYKQQLQNYQANIIDINRKYEEKTNQLKNQLEQVKGRLNEANYNLQLQRKYNRQMVTKNQQLLLQVEKINEQLQGYINKQNTYQNSIYSPEKLVKSRHSRKKSSTPESNYQLPLCLDQNFNHSPEDLDMSINSKYSYMYRHPQTTTYNTQRNSNQQSFTLKEYQGCIKEMEVIIQKLSRRLEMQLKVKSNLVSEIDRMCQSVRKSQAEIQTKNNRIYQLEKQILMGQSKQLRRSRQTPYHSNAQGRQAKQIKKGTSKQKSQQAERKYSSLNKFSSPKVPQISSHFFPRRLQQPTQQNPMIVTFRSYNEYYDTRCNQANQQQASIGSKIKRAKSPFDYQINKPKPSQNICFQQ